MPVSFNKGQKTSLSAKRSGLSKVVVGLGWDALEGGCIDLDAAAFLLTSAGKVSEQNDFVYYGNVTDKSGAVRILCDSENGEGEGDDEQIYVDLSEVPAHIDKIVFAATIYEAEERSQNFGGITNGFIRIYNRSNNAVLLEYDLDEDFSIETGIVFGELCRKGNEWEFNAVGEGFRGGFQILCKRYGVDVQQGGN